MQLTDYAMLGNEGLTLSSGTYGTTYYTLTGFHGAHVFGGVIMLVGRPLSRDGRPVQRRHYDAVEAASLYWHFVDVVWILLFSLLYLLPGKTPRPRSRSPCIHSDTRATPLWSGSSSSSSAWSTGPSPRRRARHRYDIAAGTTMLLFLGVAMAIMAYVLVAGSRTTEGPPAADRSPTDARTDLDPPPPVTARVRHADWGAHHRRCSRSRSRSSSSSSCMWMFRRLRTAPPARRGKQRIEPRRPPASTCPARRSRRSSRRSACSCCSSVSSSMARSSSSARSPSS